MKFFNLKILVFSVFIFFVGFSGYAQKTAIYDQPSEFYQSALALYNKQQYGPSQNLFQKSIDLVSDPYSIMRINAEYYKALCAVELFNDDAELLLLQFINKHPESMHIKHIYFQLGVFQYRKKGYKRSLHSFQKVDVYDLTKEEQIEFYFKRGYAYFKRDSIALAKKNFFEIINKEGKYQPPAMYYYSHIAYIEKNYETALKGFLSLKDNTAFKPVIPYYVTHIYYMQKKYNELLEVAPKLLESSTPKRQPEIARLIGEAYYRTGKYEQSIPYLERYYKSTPKSISAANQYQMAYAYYSMEEYKKAIPYFEGVSQGADEMAQSANYHLAICYIKTGKKNYALNSFQYAYKINIDANVTADALYNFAKLSYELDYNPYNQAVKAFEKYVNEYPQSEHRKEAMTYLTRMYLSTNNYAQALESIEKIQDKTPELMLAYQRILYSNGVQSFNQSEFQKAIDFFDRSIKINKDKAYLAKSLYWKSESYYRLKIYNASISSYKAFLISPGAFSEVNYNEAHYNLGYSYFHMKKYEDANKEFRIFILNIKDKQSVLANDAYNRIGDSYFIQSEFKLAVESYNNGISIGKRDVDYALYKKAEALGPLSNFELKAATFAKLVNDYPKSTYAGNAEYELAQTYYQVLKDFNKAETHYLHIIEAYSSQTNFVKKAKLNLGYLYNSSQRPEEAIKILKKVYADYKGSNESNEALSTLQDIYTDQGDVDDFFVWVEKHGVTIRVSVQDSANYTIAENAYIKNNSEEAVAAFSHYIDRFPTGYFINNAHFYRAESERKLEKYVDALKDYQYIVDQAVSKYTEKSILHISDINYNTFKDYAAARPAFAMLREFSESKENNFNATIGMMRCDWYTESYDSVLVSSDLVLNLENIDEKLEREAKIYQSRVYMMKENWDKAEPVLLDLSNMPSSLESTEAKYNLAFIAYERELYDTAESIAYVVVQQEPSYEYWVVKALILSSDIFVKTDNLHQAKATLASIVDNYNGDEKLLQQAKDKLKVVNKLSKVNKNDDDNAEVIIDLGDDNSLFITDDNFQFEEETVEEEDLY